MTTSETIGALAARSPIALQVLSSHGIDFCCGGHRSVEEACTSAGMKLESLLAEIALAEDVNPVQKRWDDEALPELVRQILDRFHAPLPGEMARLAAMAHKVAVVHASRDGERLAELARVVDALRDELIQHMEKEELILFPWILSGRGRTAGAPIRVMQAEHESASLSLIRIRDLTDDFTPHRDACPTWRGLIDGLAAFDRDLREHIHLENNILFPRALAA